MNTPRHPFFSEIIRKALVDCLAIDDHLANSNDDPIQMFHSSVAAGIKAEIIKAGRKLWDRQYVDGNGGNISVRLSPRYVLCTPTLCSKADLTLDDLSLIDMENRQLIGSRPQSSEMLLHLEIYKTVPSAHAIIHCHPPYATAHAIAGVIPPGNLVPEQEVFCGPLALTPYETPGTLEFAHTILPVAKKHNTILLANHGVVCWADTVTHAEWYVEVVDTYCKTIMIASQLKSPLPEIPPEKIAELLAIKKKLGLPDARLTDDADPEPRVDKSETPYAIPAALERFKKEELDELVSSLTDTIVAFIEKRA